MKKILFKILRYSGLPWLFREVIQRNKVSILMFHDISNETGKRMFAYLDEHYSVISLDTYLTACKGGEGQLPPKPLIITFDDGHRRNYELLPLFQQYNWTPTIFLCSGIINTNRHYWFTFTAPGITKTSLKKLSNKERLQVLEKAGFLVDKEFNRPQALDKKQIEKMRDQIDFQAHTIMHPCLPTCTSEEARQEIEGCKQMLEQDYDFSIKAFAYPNGDYTEREVQFLRKAGYSCGLTVDYGFNSINSDLYRLKRLSVNDTENMDEFVVKASGCWGWLKNLKKG